MQLAPKDLAVVIITYDEPNADENHQALIAQRPDCQRVHGVRGSDAAHKAAARVAAADRFITVDGDTRVSPLFWQQTFDTAPEQHCELSVLSFSSRNSVNDLCYGNGGIKIWPTSVVMNMQTHEQAQDPHAATDFCWHLDYVLMPGVWSQSLINATAKQAWRAGFREGVKFSQIDGAECKDPDLWQRKIAEVNLRRLVLWQQLGQDRRWGLWAILGARQGFYQALLTDWPTVEVRDFDCLDRIWQDQVSGWDKAAVMAECQRLATLITDSVSIDITVTPPSSDVSAWCRRFWPQTPRTQAKRLRS